MSPTTIRTILLTQLWFLCFGFSPGLLAQPRLGMAEAVAIAQKHDPWIQQANHQQAALSAQADAATSLSSPKLSLTMANLPTDSFNFDQEPMTQFNVGVSQQLPRGKQLKIRQQHLQDLSEQWPYRRANRLAEVQRLVSLIWLDIYLAQGSIQRISANRDLFEKMAEIAERNYGAALGRTRQQDVLQAQVELTRLRDRLQVLQQKQDVGRQRLREWLQPLLEGGNLPGALPGSSPGSSQEYGFAEVMVASSLPNLESDIASLQSALEAKTDQQLLGYFSKHPAIQSLQQLVDAGLNEKQLALEQYKPQWGINASYGYREDGPGNNTRADFFSLGVSLDMPIFTRQKQDKTVLSAVEKVSALRTQKWQALRSMFAAYKTELEAIENLNQRQNLYEQALLPQVQQQAEAVLTAYDSDDGDFSEVMRARIAQVNAEIEALTITVEKSKALVRLNYFLLADPEEVQGNE